MPTNTSQSPTQTVTVLGPNLRDQSKGTFHVHAAGCADITRQARREPMFREGWDVTAASREDVAGIVYEDILAEDDGETAADYVGDFHFAPCVHLPPTR